VNAASAIDWIRTLIAAALPADVRDASVVIGHPGLQEDYAFALSLFVLQLRDDAAWRSARPGPASRVAMEADVLIASHAPPERWFDGIRLLEAACDIVRANPHLGSTAGQAAAEVHLRAASIAELTGLWRAVGTPMQPCVLCTVRLTSELPGQEPPG